MDMTIKTNKTRQDVRFALSDEESRLLGQIARILGKKSESGGLAKKLFLKGLRTERQRLGIYVQMLRFLAELRKRGMGNGAIAEALKASFFGGG